MIITRQDAIHAGLKRYFTGKKCKYGHITERYVVDCKCVDCQKEKQNYHEHKEYMKNYKEVYNEITKEQRAEYAKKYRAENLVQEKKRQEEYRNRPENRLYHKEYYKKYYIENKERKAEYAKKYLEKNSHRILANTRKRQIILKSSIPIWYEKERNKILDIYKDCRDIELLCLAYGEKIKFHVDHIIPLQHDLVCGLHCLSNLQILTAEENLKKSNNFEVLSV